MEGDLKYGIQNLASPEVSKVIQENPMAVLPFGSVEQHGPHLPCGTDTFAAEIIAGPLSDRLECLYVPFSAYGVTPPHAGFPGTISLSRVTFELLIRDICTELMSMGVKRFVMVNWHEAHAPSINSVCTELQDQNDAVFVVVHAHFVAQRIYAECGGLTHGGAIETMAVMAKDPQLVNLDRVKESTRPAGAEALDAMRRSNEIYGFVTDFRELAKDGWYGDPLWATSERAASFAETVVDEIMVRLADVLKALTASTSTSPSQLPVD